MSQFLEDFKIFITDNQVNIYTVGEYCTGNLPEELEIQPCNPCNNTYSVSKVFTVTAVGLLVDRGLLCTDEVVADILRDELPVNYHPYWNKTTVDMLLRHRVGLPGGSLDIDCIDASKFDPDYLKEVTTLPWDCPPDTTRRYTDGAFYVLSRIVAKRAGEPMQQFLWNNLFLPLGFKEVAWSTCPQGHAMGATGLYIRSSDMVKLGALYLQTGVWQKEQILSEQWVKTVFEKEYELAQIGTIGAYHKGGMRGQNLMILPSQNRVVGWLAHLQENALDLERFVLEY